MMPKKKLILSIILYLMRFKIMVELEIGCLLSQINAHWISQPYVGENDVFNFPDFLVNI